MPYTADHTIQRSFTGRGYPDYYRAGQTWQEQAGDFKAATFFRRKRGSGNGIGTSYHVV